jgi:hypothetical protein
MEPQEKRADAHRGGAARAPTLEATGRHPASTGAPFARAASGGLRRLLLGAAIAAGLGACGGGARGPKGPPPEYEEPDAGPIRTAVPSSVSGDEDRVDEGPGTANPAGDGGAPPAAPRPPPG